MRIRIKKCLGWALGEVFPFISAPINNLRIAKNSRSVDLNEIAEKYSKLSIDRINQCHELELKRLKEIQQRCQSLVFTITLAVTLTFGMSGFLFVSEAQIDGHYFAMVVILVGLSALFFAFGAYLAIQAFNVVMLRDRYLQSEMQIEECNLSEKDYTEKLMVLKAILLNQQEALYIGNSAVAAFKSLRNGILILSVSIIILFILMLCKHYQ